MSALPSRVATLFTTNSALVTTNAAIVGEINRVADLPVNILQLFLFLRDVFRPEVYGEPKICGLAEAQDTYEVAETRSEFLQGFLDGNLRGSQAINELGLVKADLLHIVDLFCGSNRLRALLRTASEPPTVAQASAGGPVAPSGKVTSAKTKG